jgi:asparagine synthetase B (glutamine-hydrolysing)
MALLRLIEEAVYDSFHPDEAVAAVVSGGIDSSTVTAVARGFWPELPTFTGYYDGAGFDERQYARLVTDPKHHTEVLITPQDFIDHFDAFALHMREPYQGMGAFGQYMIGKRLAEDGIKVALSGEGSDELFGGYARLLAVAGEKLPDGYENYQIPDGYPRDLPGALAYDYARLPDLLAVDDQCMNAHGIEARAPFTDQRIADYALELAPRMRVGKKTLKRAVRSVVPDAILDRTDKKGFPIPLVAWAQGPCRDFIVDRIGYIPDPERQWDRGFWYDLLRQAAPLSVAA